MVEDAANRKRLEVTCDLVPADTRTVVDVGCGNGVFARLLRERRPAVRVTCVDRSASALENVVADEVRRCEITRLPFEAQSFDCVTCLQVIEHLPVPAYERALAELSRIARRSIVISVPYREAIGDNVDQCPVCLTIFNRDLHLRSFDDENFANLLRPYGFGMDRKEVPVTNSYYLGFRSYFALLRLLQGEGKDVKQFRSPVCPLCGYVPPPSIQYPTRRLDSPHSPKIGGGRVRRLAKKLWPKCHRPGYWIVGRFSRLAA